ncbi:MAG: SPOR domain-containing protein [Pseudomonadota bacterium]
MRILPIAAILAASALCGCGTTAQTPTPRADETAKRGPYFCQTGEDPQGWECVASETIAITRKPPQPEQRQTRQSQPEVPAPNPARGSDLATSPARPPSPTTQTTQTVRTPAPALRDRAPQTRQQVPEYVALSYTPDKPVSILELPPEFYAVQLLALSGKDKLEEFAVHNNINGMSAARVASNGNLMFALLLGIYETRERAEKAITHLPAPFDQHRPWIRSVGSLQEAMIAGDNLAGTSEIE